MINQEQLQEATVGLTGKAKARAAMEQIKEQAKTGMLKSFIEGEANFGKTQMTQQKSNVKKVEDDKTVSAAANQEEIQKRINDNFKNF